MNRTITLTATLAALASPALADAERCAAATGLAPEGVTLTSAVHAPAGEDSPVPHCILQGVMDERTGSDGRPYALRFELRLPDDWAGPLMHQFNGGNDGNVRPALGQITGLAPRDGALARGMAVVSSDAGHDGGANPELGLTGSNAFGLDFQARRDYGYAAVARLQPVAVALTEAYYGSPVTYRYGMGVSNGGRHAMVAASRMGAEFDGLLAGYPGFNLPRAALQHAWDVQNFLSVGETLASAFTPEELGLVAGAITGACDALDGLEDGLVLDVAACQTAFDPATLTCAEGQNSDCLPAEKVAALVRIHEGPSTSDGTALYSDWVWDAGIASGNWRFWKLESSIPPWGMRPVIGVMGAGSLGAIFTTPPTLVEGTPEALEAFLLGFDLDARAGEINATTPEYPESAVEVMTPPDMDEPHLAEFAENGGRLVIFHGTADPVFSFNDTVGWYQRLQANTDGADFVRLYAVPGMPHGQGGPSVDAMDMLSALTDWVEDDTAPGPIPARVREDNMEAPEAARGQERLLCPWPQVARHADGAFACQ